jgi:hypothetical protein
MAADLSIAGMLTFLLQRARGKPSERSKDPFKATVDGAVQRLVTHSIYCVISLNTECYRADRLDYDERPAVELLCNRRLLQCELM